MNQEVAMDLMSSWLAYLDDYHHYEKTAARKEMTVSTNLPWKHLQQHDSTVACELYTSKPHAAQY